MIANFLVSDVFKIYLIRMIQQSGTLSSLRFYMVFNVKNSVILILTACNCVSDCTTPSLLLFDPFSLIELTGKAAFHSPLNRILYRDGELVFVVKEMQNTHQMAQRLCSFCAYSVSGVCNMSKNLNLTRRHLILCSPFVRSCCPHVPR